MHKWRGISSTADLLLRHEERLFPNDLFSQLYEPSLNYMDHGHTKIIQNFNTTGGAQTVQNLQRSNVIYAELLSNSHRVRNQITSDVLKKTIRWQEHIKLRTWGINGPWGKLNQGSGKNTDRCLGSVTSNEILRCYSTVRW